MSSNRGFVSYEDSAGDGSAARTPDPLRWKALAVLCAAFFMVCLDGQIVILALPSIEQELRFSAAGVQWVLSAYMLALGGLLLLGGRVSDFLGRRRIFMLGTVFFLASSLLCGLAWTGNILISARVVQGISAAIMTPAALSILMTTFEEGAERNRALALWSAMGASGATAALLLGGPLNDWLGWEWIFFINVPVCLILLLLSPILLNESSDRSLGSSFDVAGAVTITSALVAFVYAISEVPVLGWGHTQTISLLTVSALLLGLFLAIEGLSAAPLVPLRIFRSRALVGGNLTVLISGMLVFGMAMLVSLYAQKVLGQTALMVGIGTVVYTVTSIIASYGSGPIVGRIGVRSLATTAMLLMAAGCLLLSRVSVDGDYFRSLFPGLLVFGPGIGAAFVAGTIAALSGVADKDAGLASGINSATFHIGGALGVAVVSTVAVSYSAGERSPAALTTGFSAGFVACIALALIGVVIALALLGRLRQASDRRATSATAPSPGE